MCTRMSSQAVQVKHSLEDDGREVGEGKRTLYITWDFGLASIKVRKRCIE